MCLAIPGKILSIDKSKIANVDFDGIQREVSLELVPKAQVGDYVLIHAGFAIECIDETEAQKTLDLISEFPELA